MSRPTPAIAAWMVEPATDPSLWVIESNFGSNSTPD
jgi:hypothetical protein